MTERETRFTGELIAEGVLRYNAAKDMGSDLAGSDAEDLDVGMAIVNHLGWAPLALNEVAEDVVTNICIAFGLDPGHRTIHAIATAFIEGAMFGAVTCDTTYEKAMGL